MKNFYRKCRLHVWLACLTAGLGLLSCSDDEGGGNSGYRPDQPIVLESFYPKTGSIATQVIIEGRNFGTDAKALNVYFNEKRAAVISSIRLTGLLSALYTDLMMELMLSK